MSLDPNCGRESEDTGPGIPEREEELIFERFHRVSRTDEDYVEGMGVGLELSRSLARLHEGDIALVANQEKGAHFKLRLPLVDADEIQDVEELETNVTHNEDVLPKSAFVLCATN